jgi:hypothetical protein
MASGFNVRAEMEIKISDTYLDDNALNQGAIINILTLTPEEAFENHTLARTAVSRAGSAARFEPRWIKISQAIGAQGVIDESLTRGWINKRLKTSPAHNYNTEQYLIGMDHPESVGYIRPFGTTARGIVLKG